MKKKGETNLDLMAGLFGEIMAEILAGERMNGKKIFGKWDFSWENIFTLWMLMKIWKRIFVSSVTIH